MKTLYFDCFAGAAGDMILGALIDAGVPFDEVQRALGSLAVDGVSVSVDRVLKTGVSSLKFRVSEHGPGVGRRESGVGTPRPSALSLETHSGSDRTSGVGARGQGARHDDVSAPGGGRGGRAPLDDGEGAPARSRRLDSIIDIVGTAFAMDYLAPARVVVSPVNVGGGMVKTAHGLFPVPAPATVRLLGDAPRYSSGVQMETLTPTGALILTEYADAFGSMPRNARRARRLRRRRSRSA
jgi:pyridinium-3,5-bisthiocarboxylic acid mononucleotide nickel chelatase